MIHRHTLSSAPATAALCALLSIGCMACAGNAGEEFASGEHAEGAEQAPSEGVGDRERASEERSEAGEHASLEHASEGGEHAAGEHVAEGGEHATGEHAAEGGGEGEEGGVYIARDATWNAVRRGARLVLSFDAERDAFRGRVENTTDGPLCSVRVEVHLSTGAELGPTEPRDLAPGAALEVELPVQGRGFDAWTAHPEVSACSE